MENKIIIMGISSTNLEVTAFTLAKHLVFYTVIQNAAGIQTFLEDNDKLVTKHTGQAMLGWWSVVMLPLGQLLQLGHHVRVF